MSPVNSPDAAPQTSPEQKPGRIALAFRVLGTLKYGIALTALIVYLPFTTYRGMPMHGMLGNLFSELTPLSALVAALFVFLVAWTLMIVTGLIVNGVEVRFPRSSRGRGYRTYAQIQAEPQRILPKWADEFFSVPVTFGQFLLYTAALAVVPCIVIVHNALPADRLLAAVATVAAFVVAYFLILLAAAPAAVLDLNNCDPMCNAANCDPPLRGRWPGAKWLWEWLHGTPFQLLSEWARSGSSFLARRLHMKYILDDVGNIYPAHLLATMAVVGFVVLWAVTAWWFHPANHTAASVVYLYIGLLMFVWIFGALSFHLGRAHVSPLAIIVAFVLLGYVTKVDHRFWPAQPPTTAEISIDPIQVAVPADTNLVIVATAGGGVWAAGWTARALEQLIANRAELRQEIRVISGVSGGAVGAAFVIDGILRAAPGTSPASVLHDARVRSTASSLEPVAYGFAFLDFPRLLSGGIYDPQQDRGQLLENEWARIATAPVAGEKVGRRPDAGPGKRRLRSLNASIRDGVVPAPIFGTTVMEAGQRLMITPITFPSTGPRARTLQEFVLNTASATPEPDIDLWTAARLSATFTYISPPVRSWLDAVPAQREHLIDGGYYDNFGVTSALDWLTPVLEARAAGDPRLRFKRVLLIELSAFAAPAESLKPASGVSAALTGPSLTALLALRKGVATSRNQIDVARFKDRWNALLHNQVRIESVRFEPQASRDPGPLSWHLSSTEIDRLNLAWGTSIDPQTWPENLRNEWRAADLFLRGEGS